MKKMWCTPKGWLFSWVSKVVLICAFCFMLTCRTEAAVKLNKSNVNLLVRRTTVLKVTGTSQKVSWSSNRKAVASVNNKGNVIAKSPGTAQITAKIGNQKYICNVTVKTDIFKTVTLKFTDLNSWKKSIRSKELELTFGGGMSSPELDGSTYYSGNIIRSRKVLSYKTVETKVSINTPGYYKTVKLKLPLKIEYQLHRHSMNIVGGSEGFGILISELANGNFTWKARCSCGLTTTASWEIPIDQDLVDAAANGFVSSKEIVSYNAKYENVYGYDVSSDDPMIAINKSSVILSKNDSVKLTANIVGNSSKTTWKSSNPSVASVNSKGKVTAKKAGTATITAKANGKMASCKVTVKNANFIKTYDRDLDGDGKKEKIQVSKDAGMMIYIDNKLQLTEKKGFKIRFIDYNKKDRYREILLTRTNSTTDQILLYRYDGRKISKIAEGYHTFEGSNNSDRPLSFALKKKGYIGNSISGDMIWFDGNNNMVVTCILNLKSEDAACNTQVFYKIQNGKFVIDQSKIHEGSAVPMLGNQYPRTKKAYKVYRYAQSGNNTVLYTMPQNTELKEFYGIAIKGDYVFLQVKNHKTNKMGWLKFPVSDFTLIEGLFMF